MFWLPDYSLVCLTDTQLINVSFVNDCLDFFVGYITKEIVNSL